MLILFVILYIMYNDIGEIVLKNFSFYNPKLRSWFTDIILQEQLLNKLIS